MSLAPGTRFGLFEVQHRIGAGGMGEVYLARDTKLGRAVALKILSDDGSLDPDRVARFRREAQLLASLNHPGIAHVYGVEEVDGQAALIMELVDGPTLAERLAGGALTVAEALSIARQIALALEAAHAQGIVHRDLKPANVKVSDSGVVKVLDFGLARTLEAAGGAVDAAASPTITSPALTARGVILGTAAYMAPEQARGRTVDKRADIWAFGCVLFEMLSGRRAFSGGDVSEVLASVLKSEPDWSALPEVPRAVATVLRRCLMKDLPERMHDIADVRFALEGAFDAVGSDGDRPASASWRRVAAVAAGAAALTALAAWAIWPRSEAPVTRFDHVMPPDQTFGRTFTQMLAVAPDGRSFMYNTPNGLYIRRLDELDARLIPDTRGVSNPFFAPDGTAIGYWRDYERVFRRSDTAGATMVTIAAAPAPAGARWQNDGTILYGQAGGIWHVSAASGATPRQIVALDDEGIYGPQLLPDGNSLLLTVTDTANWERSSVVVQSIASGGRTVVVSDGAAGRYLPTGHLIYGVGDVLYAAPFDASRGATTGAAVAVARGVLRRRGVMHYDVSRNGTLIYVRGERELHVPVWTDQQRSETAPGVPPGAYVYLRVSPDGTRVALDEQNDDNDIWIWDFAARTRTRVTDNAMGGSYPVWGTDGSRIAYSSEGSLWWKRADGAGRADRLLGASEEIPSPNLFFFFARDTGLVLRGPGAIWTKIGDGGPSRLIDGQTSQRTFAVRNPDLSPDGRWLAYQSAESSQEEVYVRPFPNTGEWRVPISTEGGIMPRWSPDGRELFYLEADGPLSPRAMMAASVDVAASPFAVGARRQLFEWTERAWTVMRGYDVAPDGRFLMLKAVPRTEEQRPRIVVVQNWFAELERLAPAKR